MKKKQILLKHKVGMSPIFPIPIRGLNKTKVVVKNGWIYYFEEAQQKEKTNA